MHSVSHVLSGNRITSLRRPPNVEDIFASDHMVLVLGSTDDQYRCGRCALQPVDIGGELYSIAHRDH